MDCGEGDIFNLIDETVGSDVEQIEGKNGAISKQHMHLLHDISVITGVAANSPDVRTEPSSEVREHLWSFKLDEDEKISLNELMENVPNSSKFGSLRQKFAKLQKSNNALSATLPKPQKEKVARQIGYEETVKKVSQWEPTIFQNREAETLQFPLNTYKPQQSTTRTVAVEFKPRNSLEKEIAAVLMGSSSALERTSEELTEEEEKALQTVDLQEAIARRKELQKIRVLQSYYEKKCKRVKRIKSKKFHRILRKAEKRMAQSRTQNLTEDQKAFLAVDTEKKRALERAHLRHRNTSKWAKRLLSKEKKSTQDKQSISNQLQISRSLTDRKFEVESEDESNVKPGDEICLPLLMESSDNSTNPWLLQGHSMQADRSKEKPSNQHDSNESACSEDSRELVPKLDNANSEQSLYRKKIDESNDSELEEDLEIQDGNSTKKKTNIVSNSFYKNTEHDFACSEQNQLDVSCFLTMESKALNVGCSVQNNFDRSCGNSKEQELLIREAFANDDVMDEFEADKEKLQRQRKATDLELTLPGWGEWAGTAVNNRNVMKRKKKMFSRNKKSPTSRRDEKLKYVIINEDKNDKFSSNQISSLPFPFSSKTQYFRSMRQPIGSVWNTPSLSAKLTHPRVSTVMGTVIDPINELKPVKNKASKSRKSNKLSC